MQNAIPPADIIGKPQVLRLRDACGNTITRNQPLTVSGTGLIIELKPDYDPNQRECPKFLADVLNFPEGCCASDFEFEWTYRNGTQPGGFCDPELTVLKGCGLNGIYALKPGMYYLKVRRCEESESQCNECIYAERLSFFVPVTHWRLGENDCKKNACIKNNATFEDCWFNNNEEKPFENDGVGTSYGPSPAGRYAVDMPDVQLMPNPAKSTLTIQLGGDLEDGHYIMRDAVGKVVAQGIINGKKHVVKTAKLPRGNYTVQIISGDKNIVQKLILE